MTVARCACVRHLAENQNARFYDLRQPTYVGEGRELKK